LFLSEIRLVYLVYVLYTRSGPRGDFFLLKELFFLVFVSAALCNLIVGKNPSVSAHLLSLRARNLSSRCRGQLMSIGFKWFLDFGVRK